MGKLEDLERAVIDLRQRLAQVEEERVRQALMARTDRILDMQQRLDKMAEYVYAMPQSPATLERVATLERAWHDQFDTDNFHGLHARHDRLDDRVETAIEESVNQRATMGKALYDLMDYLGYWDPRTERSLQRAGITRKG